MRRWIVLVAACSLWRCAKSEPEEPRFEKKVTEQPPGERAAPVDAGSVAAPDNPHSVVISPDVREGWEHEDLDDKVPLCIFSDYEARNRASYIEQMQPQQLKADARVVFGAFAHRCLHRDCDDSPTLQAWIDEDVSQDHTFVVHTKYTGEHKTGAHCDKCEVVIAATETPPLAPGTYVVKYGALTQEFKVPSVLKQPCLGMKLPAAKKKGKTK